MTATVRASSDGTSAVILVGGVEAGRFAAAGLNKVAPGVITPAMLALAATPLGVGQTWQNLSGSRAVGVTYTNSTSQPIVATVQVGNNSNANASFLINGLAMGNLFGGSSANTQATYVIPAGATYGINPGIVMNTWCELR